MPTTLLHLIPGIAFGAMSVLLHLQKQKISFANLNWKYISFRFFLGFGVGLATLPVIFWFKSYAVELLMDNPDFLLTKGQKILVGVGVAVGFFGGAKLGQRESRS